jgi:hypothetical protein
MARIAMVYESDSMGSTARSRAKTSLSEVHANCLMKHGKYLSERDSNVFVSVINELNIFWCVTSSLQGSGSSLLTSEPIKH